MSDGESAEASLPAAGGEGRHRRIPTAVTTTGHLETEGNVVCRLLELKYLDCKFSFCQVFLGREERLSSLTIAHSSETVPSGTSFSPQVRKSVLLHELKYFDCKFSFCQVFWGREERVSSLTIARSSETVPSGTSFSLLLHQGQVRESVLLLESSDDIFAGILKSCD